MSRTLFTASRAAKELDALLASPKVAAACAAVASRTSRGDVIADACDRIEAEFGRAGAIDYPPCEAAE